jgi:hypothetical protein
VAEKMDLQVELEVSDSEGEESEAELPRVEF